MSEEKTEEVASEDEAKAKWEAMSADEKINVVANNAMSRQEGIQRMEQILEKVQTIAVRLENLELKDKLRVQDGGAE
jgi:hypothetical protein